VSEGISVLHEGDGVLVVNKPAGVLVIPGRGEEEAPSLREQLEAQRKQKIFVVHRLDRDTSGVLVFALDAATHRALSMAFEAGEVEKHYLALVKGRLEEATQVEASLVPARRGRMRVSRAGEDGKAALTRLRPLERFSSATLVEAQPLSGRTHQIRVHLGSIGHPLLVDHQYGSPESITARMLGGTTDEVVLSRTPLHAARVRLRELPQRSAPLEVEAPLPADLSRALELLRKPGPTAGP
jgi:RluA family pseudouridine synthase